MGRGYEGVMPSIFCQRGRGGIPRCRAFSCGTSLSLISLLTVSQRPRLEVPPADRSRVHARQGPDRSASRPAWRERPVDSAPRAIPRPTRDARAPDRAARLGQWLAALPVPRHLPRLPMRPRAVRVPHLGAPPVVPRLPCLRRRVP